MKACIPTRADRGLEDTVYDHFGSAPYFTLYDTETGEVTVLKNRNRHHSHGTCHPMNQLAGYNIDCVVCSGLGWRAIAQLKKEGIRVYQASGDKVRGVAEKLKANQLPHIEPSKICPGRGRSGRFAHGMPGRGQGDRPGGRFGEGGRGRRNRRSNS
jgi:predicted Fe-Mo cluster-binding NifX family protein